MGNCVPLDEHKTDVDVEEKPLLSKSDKTIAYQLVPSPSKKSKRCYAEINLESFNHNLTQIIKMSKATNCEPIAVVKANAYGHGAVRLCQEALKHGVTTFGTATILEAIELRRCKDLQDKKIKIIVLGVTVRDEYPLFAQYRIDMMLSSSQMVDNLLKWASERKDNSNIIEVHCMMDTGMTRIGFQENECLNGIEEMNKNGDKYGIKFVGLCTHIAMALNEEYTLEQFNRFTNILTSLEEKKINVEMFHFESSKVLMLDVIDDDKVKSFMDHDTTGYTRTGSALYGDSKTIDNVKIYTLMSFFAQIRHIQSIKKGTSVGYDKSWIADKDCLIATLSAGYADGYPRGMSNKQGVIRIGDQLFDIAGKICMDMMMVNLGNKDENPSIMNIKVGHYACLFGPKHDHQKNTEVVDMAQGLGAGYSGLEITCGLTKRVPLVYK